MQYLLTEEEMKQLKKVTEKEQHKIRTTLQDLCTRVCNHEPVKWGWGKPDDPKPWGCILTQHDWYCDSCPVQGVCPYEAKRWSK